MIGRLHRNNALGQIGSVCANVAGEFRLCARWADDQYLAGIGESFATSA